MDISIMARGPSGSGKTSMLSRIERLLLQDKQLVIERIEFAEMLGAEVLTLDINIDDSK